MVVASLENTTTTCEIEQNPVWQALKRADDQHAQKMRNEITLLFHYTTMLKMVARSVARKEYVQADKSLFN